MWQWVSQAPRGGVNFGFRGLGSGGMHTRSLSSMRLFPLLKVAATRRGDPERLFSPVEPLPFESLKAVSLSKRWVERHSRMGRPVARGKLADHAPLGGRDYLIIYNFVNPIHDP